MLRFLSVTLALCGPALASVQQDPEVLEGHSQHGAAFNEGPRQAAYLMEGQGNVDFAVTLRDATARKFFQQGIGQLHGFWYLEAERSFRQVATIEPECAMAYWGMAIATLEEAPERAEGFAREAWLRRDQVTEREKLYITAVKRYFWGDAEPVVETGGDGKAAEATAGKVKDAKKPAPEKPNDGKARRKRLIEDLEEIVYQYPHDIEAKAFLVNQMWLNSYHGRMEITSRAANQALLDAVFAANPLHPAHHYRVHLWDQKKNAHRVADSAAKIGHSAPGIAHMWHMGGHIWARLGRHDDAAWQQEASARIDHAHMMRDRVLPDEIHNFAHNNEWLIRSLRNVGRVREAVDLAKNMVELPRHPKFNTFDMRGSAMYGRRRLFEVLSLYELHEDLIKLSRTMYLDVDVATEPLEGAKLAFALGQARLARGEIGYAEREIDEIGLALAAARKARAADVDAAETEALDAGKPRKDVTAAIDAAIKEHESDVRRIHEMADVLSGLVELARGEVATDEQFEALQKRLRKQLGNGRIARLWSAVGRHEDAVKLAKEGTKNQDGVALPLADLAYVQWRAGKHDDAKATFADLRAMSARFDLDVAPFRRLAPIAQALDLPTDWRVPVTVRDDVGDRPELDSLGPFRWSPVAAPAFSLPDAEGDPVALADQRGRPVIVIFFLGFGCVHCVEQLKVFHEVYSDFLDAGIDIVAVGTDTKEKAAGAEDPIGFPVLANPELDVFRQYRCFDDFEQLPLHGTFLVDADGFVRWQDVSFEPFVDHEFLLAEARRLLELPVGERR